MTTERGERIRKVGVAVIGVAGIISLSTAVSGYFEAEEAVQLRPRVFEFERDQFSRLNNEQLIQILQNVDIYKAKNFVLEASHDETYRRYRELNSTYPNKMFFGAVGVIFAGMFGFAFGSIRYQAPAENN